ncbi:MAG: PTS system mannose/fructose/sorbose family transporter subunit IID [Clostridium sp.]|uniref:PTS system mannose/fructose/sorbose family transporter subunit IID n=1 Tax=Clostridium sp. TaxID=1506 RepID=UPI002911A77C|nr:PTS system mannose/fructose/sorbose family transporter subunit IID [Clostridium sp.]MDU5110802.1 PTS system mannose/fructose/sorbose family transporter subunit IID [Clostridium sp.]
MGKNVKLKENGKLTKKDLFKAYINWITYALSCQNMERMEAPAFVRMMGKIGDKLYTDKEDKQKLMERHSQFFNTEPLVGAIIPGIAIGLEEKKAQQDNDIPDEMITGIKTALMGPFAGIGDSLISGTLIPILLSIALGLSKDTGSLAGPIFYVVAFLGIMIPLTWGLFYRGYKTGLDAAGAVLSKGIKDKVIRVANIVGLIVVGSISAQYVGAQVGLSYNSGESVFALQAVLDSIFPSLVPLLLTLLSWFLLDKKKISMGWVFVIFIAIAIVGSLTGILIPV